MLAGESWGGGGKSQVVGWLLRFIKAAALPEEVSGWVADVRCHSQRGFWKGGTSAGPREEEVMKKNLDSDSSGRVLQVEES